MTIDRSSFSPNEAWILLRLNQAPISTEVNGDFHAMAIMDASSGMIFGVEMVPETQPEISEIQARWLLSTSAYQAGGRLAWIFIATESLADQACTAASTMKIEVRRVPASDLAEITKEATDGFAARISGGRHE